MIQSLNQYSAAVVLDRRSSPAVLLFSNFNKFFVQQLQVIQKICNYKISVNDFDLKYFF